VAEITSSQSYDPVLRRQALPGGLYDPRLGPLSKDQGSPCKTCSMTARDCPGHFGHIELAVPVYHPLLFKDILSVLNCKCFGCHRLRAPPIGVRILKAKFHLLFQHRIQELIDLNAQLEVVKARAMNELLGNADEMDDDGDDDSSSGGDDDEAREKKRKKKKNTQRSQSKAAVSIAAAESSAEAVDQLLQQCLPKPGDYHDLGDVSVAAVAAGADGIAGHGTGRTASPSASQLPIRSVPKRVKLNSYERELLAKLVKESLMELKKRTANTRCHYCGAFAIGVRQVASNKIFQKALPKKARKIHAAENIRIVSALQDEQERARLNHNRMGQNNETSQYDSDDSNAGAFEDEDSDDGSSSSSSDSNDEDEDLAKAGGGGKSPMVDLYMHPNEVMAQLRRTWELEPFLCNCLFALEPSFSETSAFLKYFMHVLPVPPSRFRPSMQMNGMAVEHTQTVLLSNAIQLNEVARAYMVAGATTPNQSTYESRFYSTWMDLQATVNCFMDSEKDTSAGGGSRGNQTAGIRQILERKEGLFRKNMMGKRVDYACRSVISPDPYIGANEIGLPKYFATVLTYPTPVTHLNIREMRSLVERGVSNYPGARWVELDGGKRIDLSRMKRHKREAVAARLLAHLKNGDGMPAKVGRQLRDGDYVLMNRQVRTSIRFGDAKAIEMIS